MSDPSLGGASAALAKDAAGRDLLKVRVAIDGLVVAEALDGKAVTLDPGARHVRFELAGAHAVEQDIVVQQGEKNRRVLRDRRSASIQPGGNVGPTVGTLESFATALPGTPFETDTQGNHSHDVPPVGGYGSGPTNDGLFRADGNSPANLWYPPPTAVAGNHSHTVTSGGDVETRPANVSVNYIIRL